MDQVLVRHLGVEVCHLGVEVRLQMAMAMQAATGHPLGAVAPLRVVEDQVVTHRQAAGAHPQGAAAPHHKEVAMVEDLEVQTMIRHMGVDLVVQAIIHHMAVDKGAPGGQGILEALVAMEARAAMAGRVVQVATVAMVALEAQGIQVVTLERGGRSLRSLLT